MFKFEIIKKSKKSKARIGKITTPHGEIITPAFIPVATLGLIKGGLDSREIKESGAQCQITNTFHFWDMDRDKLVKKTGGLHKFMNFSKPIFTDSGGFQVFSLGKGAEFGLGKIGSIFPHENPRKKNNELTQIRTGLVKKISEEGVKFNSPRDGRTLMLTPEKSAEIQTNLGADFIYLLDICGSVTDNHAVTKEDLEKTGRWYKRFLEAKNKTKNSKKQKVFGIIQGGLFKDLRLAATKMVNDLPVFGIALGGALGKDTQEMLKIISWINGEIDWNRPHHLLGVGDLKSIPQIIKLGIDLFDCALPTRIARHGTAIIENGYLNLNKSLFKKIFKPILKNCHCFTCENYTIAQINFLLRAKETLAGKLITIHNLFFLEAYLKKIRDKIDANML